jgi:hypothetical protein
MMLILSSLQEFTWAESDINCYLRSDQVWQSSGPAKVSSLILVMFSRLAEADWFTMGQMADAIASSFPQPHYIGQHI